MGLLQRLNNEGSTIMIATTHFSVARCCSMVARIAEGRVIDDEPVSQRRIISPTDVPGSSRRSYAREVVVCPRCSYGNFKDQKLCARCETPLQLTNEDEQTIETRLSGTENCWLGVEGASDEGEVHGQDLIEKLKDVLLFAGLGSKSLVNVIPVLEERCFRKGATIVKQKAPWDSFYVIRSGTVQVLLEKTRG